jgi:phosphohistidine phosphatase
VAHELYLLRHAKSSWDDPSLVDHERPLAPRGRRAAKKIAAHMKDAGIEPTLVLCSSSRRTRETLAAVGPALGGEGSVSVEPELYAASDDDLVARLRRLPESVSSVLLIGHNPGLQDLALRLAQEGQDLTRLREKFPTAALATLELTSSWADLTGGAAALVGYVLPRELG